MRSQTRLPGWLHKLEIAFAVKFHMLRREELAPHRDARASRTADEMHRIIKRVCKRLPMARIQAETGA